MTRIFRTMWLAAVWLAMWCVASPTWGDEPSSESASALTRIAAEVQAMRQQLAETTQQLDAARAEIESLRKQLADDSRAAQLEQWRQARKDAEAERIALNREAARLETTREEYLKTAHVEAERFEQMQARVERDQQRQPEELEGLRRPLRQVARNNLEPTAPVAGPAYYGDYGYGYDYAYYGAYPFYYYPRSVFFYPYYGQGGFHSVRDSAAYPYSHIHGSRIYPWARSPFISGGGGRGHHSHSSSGLNLKLNLDSGSLKLNIGGGGHGVRHSRW